MYVINTLSSNLSPIICNIKFRIQSSKTKLQNQKRRKLISAGRLRVVVSPIKNVYNLVMVMVVNL